MHCVTVRDASNNISVYINGTRVATGTSTTNISVSSNTSYIGTRYNVANLLGGYVSNTRITKGRAVYDPTQSNLTVPTTPLTRTTGGTNPPQGTECSLLTCQSNRFLDSNGVNVPASSPLTITATGSPTVVAFSPFNPTASWSAATYGGSGYFDGSGDYLSAASNTALNLTGDYTVECWFYANSFPTQPALFGIGSDAAGLVLTIVSSKVYAYFVGVGNVFGSGGTTLITNSWNHIAIVRSGTTNTCYINGSQSGTTYSSSSTISSTGGVGIGRTVTGSSFNDWNGYVADFRIVKGTAVYTGAFTPPTAPITNAGSTSAASYPSTTNVNTSFASSATSLLLNFTNAGIYDATSKNDLETVGNAQISTTQSKWGGSSINFDGTGDYLLQPDRLNYDFGTGDFTIEAWIYLASTPSTTNMILDTRASDSLSNYSWSVSSTSKLDFVYGATRVTSSGSISTSSWVYVAVRRSSGTLGLYINGSLDGTASYSSAINTAAVPSIGAGRSGGTSAISGYYFNGYIQDLRVTKGYARTVTTTPTAAFPTL